MAIAQQINALHEEGVAYRDIAVLYRAHYVTRNIEDAFIDAKLPYTIYSGVQFFDRAEVKDALSYLRMATYKDVLEISLLCAGAPHPMEGANKDPLWRKRHDDQ